MASENFEGMSISCECSELIEDLKEDIAEFGGDKTVDVWCEDIKGVTIYINYDISGNGSAVSDMKLEKGEYIQQMTASALLVLLEKQNSVI